MKRLYLILLSVFLSVTAFGQITTTRVVVREDKRNVAPYDSTKNYVGKDVYQYIGQELYVNPKNHYRGFFQYDENGIRSTYMPDETGRASSHDKLAEKYFTVLDVLDNPDINNKSDEKFYLKMKEKESGDIVFFEYRTNTSDQTSGFPFYVVGFFEKHRKKYEGNELIFTNTIQETLKDTNTGKPIVIKTGKRWKCTAFTIDEDTGRPILIIENSSGEKSVLSYGEITSNWGYMIYMAKDADKYRRRFGQAIFAKILEGHVMEGMTREMCKLAWGEPESINNTLMYGRNTEQWVYRSNYLSFRNGKLVEWE